jgi:hypothetical protein
MGDPTVGALAASARALRAVRWRRPSIRSLRQSSAIASHMSPSRHCSTNPLDGRQHRKKVKSHKPMRTLTKSPAASGRTLVSEPADDGISASEVGARPFALDEMAVTIAGRQFWLWRAVDDEGEVLDLYDGATRLQP